MFRHFVPICGAVILFLQINSGNCAPAPVTKKDSASKPLLQLDQFVQDHEDIDPLHHEESYQRHNVRSINPNPNSHSNASPVSGTGVDLVQAITKIQTAAQKAGINLNPQQTSASSSTGTNGGADDVQTQILKLKEQAELYQMINDMLKAETMVQAQPYAVQQDPYHQPATPASPKAKPVPKQEDRRQQVGHDHGHGQVDHHDHFDHQNHPEHDHTDDHDHHDIHPGHEHQQEHDDHHHYQNQMQTPHQPQFQSQKISQGSQKSLKTSQVATRQQQKYKDQGTLNKYY